MKANEFVKKLGWKKVKHCTKPTSRDNFFIIGGKVIRDQDLIDLKRLVESHELVESYGGLKKSREYLDEKSVFEWTALDGKLSQAICDVERCQ